MTIWPERNLPTASGFVLAISMLVWPFWSAYAQEAAKGAVGIADANPSNAKTTLRNSAPTPQDDLRQLRSVVFAQQGQIAAQQRQLGEQQQQLNEQREQLAQVRLMVAAQQRLLNGPAGMVAGEASPTPTRPALLTETTGPSAVEPMVLMPPSNNRDRGPDPFEAPQAQSTSKTAPLSLAIGDSTLTPQGFMDLTFVGRTTNVGSGIGTNFGSIPLKSFLKAPNMQVPNPQGRIGESTVSSQNSRLGLRFDSLLHDTRPLLGYFEGDFLGNQPNNALVSSNSFTFRLRLLYVELKGRKQGTGTRKESTWEVLAGQTWSLMTPGRDGISPQPDDIFFTQDVDTNYQVGLPWARVPGFRFAYLPKGPFTFAAALENAQQYIGGSAGGGLVTLPSSFAGLAQNPTTQSLNAPQLNNGSLNFSVPNLHPDVLGKAVWEWRPDGRTRVHIEAAGVVRSFRIVDNNAKTFGATGRAGSLNSNWEVLKNDKLRLIENFFYGRGAGRYLFGQGPDLVVNPDGRLGLITVAGTVNGFESKITDSLLLYGYFGGDYFGRAVIRDPSSGAVTGYGFPGVPDAYNNNRTIKEYTGGAKITLWGDEKWGKLQLLAQYSYLSRQLWWAPVGQTPSTNTNMIFMNLRYVLPGDQKPGPPK